MTTDLTTALAQAKTGPLGLSDEHEARAAAEEREIEAMARAIAENGDDRAFDRNCDDDEWCCRNDTCGWRSGEEYRACYRSDAAAARAALDAVRAGAPDDLDAEAWRLAERRAIAERDDFRRELHAIIDEVRAWRVEITSHPVDTLDELIRICDAHDPRRTR